MVAGKKKKKSNRKTRIFEDNNKYFKFIDKYRDKIKIYFVGFTPKKGNIKVVFGPRLGRPKYKK